MHRYIVAVALLVAVRLYAHSITVDGDPTDWIGATISQNDTGYVDGGEYVWIDTVGDDIGDGGDALNANDNPDGYTYPTDSSFTGGEADIVQFRLTADDQNMYFLVKLDSFASVYTPMVVITIDVDHVSGSGEVWLPQDADLQVDSLIAWEYAIVLGDDNIKVFNSSWTDITDSVQAQAVFNPNGGYIEAGLNTSLLNSSVNILDTTIYLTCAAGLNEFGHFKEVDSLATQWHGGGGIGSNGSTDSIFWVEPDVYDLAFVPHNEQVNDLNAYNDSTLTPSFIRATSAAEVNMKDVSGIKEEHKKIANNLPVLFAHKGVIRFDGNIDRVVVYAENGAKIIERSGNINSLALPHGAFFALVKSKKGQKLYRIISSR